MPEIREGGRETGAPDTRPRQGAPLVNAPPVVLATIAVLIGIHGLLQFGGQDWIIWTNYAFALVPARFGLLDGTAMIEGSQYWSLLTYGFLHEGWLHVLLNSLWLLIFGTPVARHFGVVRFLVIVLVSTLGGAVAMLAVYWGVFIIVVGASAAVSGLLAAAIPIMFGKSGAPLTLSEFVRNRRAIIFTLVFLGMTLLTGVQGLPGFADGGRIAWEAHLGGFIAGLLSFFILGRERVQTG